MGSRATPHSAILGIPALNPRLHPTITSVIAAGARRVQACRVMLTRSLEMADHFGIANGVATVGNLETILVMMQILICMYVTTAL